MTKQQLSITQLSTLVAASPKALPASLLVDTLADHEAQISILFTDKSISGNVNLISSFYASYVLALLLVDDRFPPTLSDTDEALINTKRLLGAVWSQQYPSVYQALQQSQWPELLKPLAGRFLEHFQSSTFALLGQAYTSISPSTASTYLGFSIGAEHGTLNSDISNEKVVTEQLLQRGWACDAEQRLLQPLRVVESESSRSIVGGGHTQGVAGMASLIGLVGFLGA
ncbi:MAG: hypothetical protein M1830_008430 [Pleopsidium flavum]|nr:MAG: hypothetical protein M1830_008430 [Pleopsidium flavum]